MNLWKKQLVGNLLKKQEYWELLRYVVLLYKINVIHFEFFFFVIIETLIN